MWWTFTEGDSRLFITKCDEGALQSAILLFYYAFNALQPFRAPHHEFCNNTLPFSVLAVYASVYLFSSHEITK